MNQSCNKLRYIFIIFILLAVMILGISSQASASKLVNKMSRDDTWPLDVAVDSNGYVYAAWNRPGGIVKMDSTGNVISVFNITNDFQCPFQIAVDANGYIYVIDSTANYYRFTVLAADGSIFRQKDEFMYKLNNQLWDLTVDSSGNFYCVTYNSVAAYSPWIDKYDSNFNHIVEFATYKGQNYPCPWGLATKGDYIYYTDDGLGRIVKVDSGLIETVVKSGVTSPKLLAVDGSGNIYYTDLNTGDIRKIDTNGNVWVYAQGLNPQGIAVDNEGRVYVANRHGTSGEIDLVIPSPSVSGVSPAGGPREGGTWVTITGSEFTGASAVMFGETAAVSFTVESNNQITAVAPAGSGVADVTVTTEGGASAISANSCFYYNPVVSGISPGSGPAAGGTTVIITGTGFSSNAVVKFGSTTASFTLDSSTQITAIAPAGSGVEHVTVTTPGGTNATSSADQFTFIPDVTGFSPNCGPIQGGATVTITGHGFIGATAVKFGDTAATNFRVDSANQITALSPPGSGTVDITVITPGGVATSTTPRFSFFPTPAVSSLSLHEGTAQGFTSITITGTGFINVTGVWFGNIKARNYTVNSDTKITATTPMWGGIVHVYITTETGTSPATDNDLYRFIPSVSSFSVPDPPYGKSGPATGTTKVEIYGYGIGYVYDEATAQRILITPTAVYFGTTPATNVSSVWLYPGKINANAPPGCGVVDVTVETAYGTTAVNANAKFKYIPIVNSITVTGGPAAGGTEVTINGAGFTSDSTVKFGATAAANVTYISDKQIKAISPPGSGKVDITVATPGGTSAAGIKFTYGPVVSGISPSIGPQAGGTSVTITGSDFTGATAVKFGSANSAGFTVNSDTSITATAPAGSGMAHVTVTTPAGTSPANSKDQYYYAPIPAVTGLNPAFGLEAGGKTLAISGFGFTGTTAVQFGDKPALNFTVDNDTRITATSPAGTGAVDVIITTPGGTSVANVNAKFAYNELAPPHFDLESSGPYNTAQRVAVTCDTTGASIRYTTDGNDPDGSSALYDGTPVLITRTATLKARVFMTGWEPSAVAGKEYQINSTITKYQPRNDDPQTSPNLVFTAQNFRNDPSVQFNSASLWLGRGNSGSYSDLWLYFPHLIGDGTGQIPEDAKIVSAKLVLTLIETNGNQNQPRGFKLYQITDPEAKGKPHFGSSGLFKGLDFKYRDHRLGRNIKWIEDPDNTDQIDDIFNLFKTALPVDTYEMIPSVFQNEEYSEVRLDVTSSIVDWLSKDVKKENQGWFLTVDENLKWGYNDSLVFYGVAEEVASRRPRLEVTYIAQNVDNTPPGPVTDLSATIINQSVELKWTKPNGAAGVVLVCKAGVIPADPTDGAIVYDGPAQIYLDNKGLSSGKTYYYAVFAYDDLRNYSSEDYEKVILVTGGPSSPSNLTVSLSDNKLTFNWNDNSDNEDWFVIEQQKSGDSTWRPVAYPGAGQTDLVVKCDDPNFNLEPNTTYQYRIKAVNAFGSSVYAVNAGNITTPGFPAAPANLAWIIISAGRVNLSWTDKAGNETAYRVDVCSNDAGHTIIRPVNLSDNANSVSITGLKPGVQYLFKVSAVNGDGEGAVWSDIIVTTKDPKGGLL